MTSPLHQIFYISRTDLDEPLDIQSIVQVSRARNGPLRVTGALVYSGEHFAQVLEGPPEALELLMRAIHQDPRHHILYEWPKRSITDRWYPEWSMGYLQNDTLEALVRHLSRSSAPLPPLEYFVRWLVALSRLNQRSRTPPLQEP